MNGLLENTNTLILQFNRQQSKQKIQSILHKIIDNNKSLHLIATTKPDDIDYTVNTGDHIWAQIANLLTREKYVLLITPLFLEYKILEEWIE